MYLLQEMMTRPLSLVLNFLQVLRFAFGQGRRTPPAARMTGTLTRPIRTGATTTDPLAAFRPFAWEINDLLLSGQGSLDPSLYISLFLYKCYITI